MAFDGITIANIVYELNETLIDGRINKIAQPEEDELLLTPLRYLVSQGIFDKKAGVRIEKASLGNDAGVIGAAMLCNMV